MKKIFFVLSIIIGILILCVISLFIKQDIVDHRINNDISSIYTLDKYKTPVSVSGLKVIKQKISCGYACIEILSNHLGKSITEQTLLEQNAGKISTAMGNGFCLEMNKQFPEYETIKYSNLENLELIDKIYESLMMDKPVPIEFAAIYKDNNTKTWTLHFSIVTAMDIPNNSITICNPYGYKEIYTVEEFLNATRYDSYESMPFYLKIAFAAGIFTKNTIYILD